MLPKNKLFVMSHRGNTTSLVRLPSLLPPKHVEGSTTHQFQSEAKLSVFVGCCKHRAKFTICYGSKEDLSFFAGGKITAWPPCRSLA